MATVLLIRHGRTKANADGVLAGWTPGVVLDEKGAEQARELAERLAVVPLTAVVTSPLERTRETADLMLGGREATVPVHVDERVGECRYGDWTGGSLKTLAKEPMWKVVQAHPSAAVFPGAEGESMAHMQHRAVTAVREWNERLGAGRRLRRGEPRRRDQGDPRRRARHAPRPVPAAARRPLLRQLVATRRCARSWPRTNDVGRQPRRARAAAAAEGSHGARSRDAASSDAVVGGGAGA